MANRIQNGSTATTSVQYALPDYLSGKGLRTRVNIPGKYITVFGVLPILLISALAGGYFFQNNGYQSTVSLEYRKNASGHKQAYYPLPELIVDLSPDYRGRTAYLKLTPAIAISDSDREATLRTIDQAKPLIIERVTLFLRALRPEDFQTAEQMQRIKHEITKRVNLGVGHEVAIDVVLEKLVIQ